MEKLNRIQRLNQILSSRKFPISGTDLQHELECSPATLKRDIQELRDFWGAPIYNTRGKGYSYSQNSDFQLPGLWFTPEELHSLFSLFALLENIQPGKLNEIIQPIKERLLSTISEEINRPAQVQRIRILGMAKRSPGKFFTTIASAVLERKKLSIEYYSRNSDSLSIRVISPQRLVFYRDNWYLDAWCHKADDLRTFSLDKIQRATGSTDIAVDVDDKKLDETLADAYGIFSGKADKLAVLHFSPKISRWVSDEQWHPKQETQLLGNGVFELRIPYGNPTELILDICRYGPDVEVVAPEELRNEIASRHREAAKQYI